MSLNGILQGPLFAGSTHAASPLLLLKVLCLQFPWEVNTHLLGVGAQIALWCMVNLPPQKDISS